MITKEDIVFCKESNGWKMVTSLDLPPEIYFFIKTAGRHKYNLKQHEVRACIRMILQDEMKRFEKENRMKFEYCLDLNKVITKDNGTG